tara:strand:+ start:734 stop:1177 length:444 start_codon:yes stop_codon:yes gene_type:complete
MNIKNIALVVFSLFSLTACYKVQEPVKPTVEELEFYYELSELRASMISLTIDSVLYHLDKNTTVEEISNLENNNSDILLLLEQIESFNNYTSEISEFCDENFISISKTTTVKELLNLKNTLNNKCNMALTLIKQIDIEKKQVIVENL